MKRVKNYFKRVFSVNNRNYLKLYGFIVTAGILFSVLVYNLALRDQPFAAFLLSFFSTLISVSVVFYSLNKWYKKNRNLNKSHISESLMRFKSIAEASNYAIWDNNLLTGETYYNETMFSIFGYKKDDAIDNETWWQSNIHPEDATRVLKGIEAKLKSSESTWNDEYRFKHKDGSYKFVLDRCYIVRNSQQEPERLIGSMMDVTDEKLNTQLHIEQLLEKKNISGRNIMEYFEQRQKEIRDVLHEEIAQELAALKFKLAAPSTVQENMSASLNKSIEQLGSSISKIRDISGKIYPANAQGLDPLSIFTDLINKFQSESGLKVELMTDCRLNYSDKEKDSILHLFYRITEIQLENILKHAGCCDVLIEIYLDEQQKCLIISDTGKGCVKELQIDGKGFTEIKSKIEMFNGMLNILAAPGKGFTLEVIILNSSTNSVFY
jgi:PAS domain S-box-containing protein